MKRYATTLIVLLCLACTTGLVQAQDLTVREIKSVPQENIDELDALGADLTDEDIRRLARSPHAGETVTFTAVVLAEPRYSGLASLRDGQPGRLHFFVRDTAAVSQGAEGMDIQIVAGDNWRDLGVVGFFKGDVITVTGEVQYFESDAANLQLAPESIEYLGDIGSLGLPESLLDPISVTTADVNKSVGEAQVQFNWANFNDLNQAYVRIDGATVWRSPNRTDARPNWAVTSDGAQTFVQNDDISLCFRNDKKDYPEGFAECKNTDFEGPAPGARVNVEGFVSLRGSFDPFSIGLPPSGVAKIVPWEEDDLEVTAQPSITSVSVAPLTEVPGNAPIPVTVTVEGDLSVVTGATLTYTPEGGEPTTVALTAQGDGTYTGEIPAQPDGTFLSYTVEVTDNTGATYGPPAASVTRVLFDGINEIADIQQYSAESGSTASPFRGMEAVSMNITATVQTPPGFSDCRNCVLGFSIQDDPDLGPWTGIFVSDDEALTADLQVGDVINITSATISENFNVTFLSDLTYTKADVSTGEPLPFKIIDTSLLQDAEVAEAHEGMLLRFENVTVTAVNADASGNFGEFAVSTDGTPENAVRVDDSSLEVPDLWNTDNLSGSEQLEFVQGVWWFSFSNWKLEPVTLADIGAVTNVAVEEDAVPGRFALAQNYPNPFNPVTTIQYEVATAGHVTLQVIDLLGRTVATLVDGDVAAGAYQVHFDGRDLASGLYLYRLTAGAQTITKKMMLLK